MHDSPLSMGAGGSGTDPEDKWRRNLSLRMVYFNGSEAVRVCNAVPKSKLRKWLARKVCVWDALVPHGACLPGHPHAVIVCVMFEIQLLGSTAQCYCSYFCQRTKNNINRVCSWRRKKIQLTKSSFAAFMTIPRVAVTLYDSRVDA